MRFAMVGDELNRGPRHQNSGSEITVLLCGLYALPGTDLQSAQRSGVSRLFDLTRGFLDLGLGTWRIGVDG
jgi:hypothetical protein